MEQQEQTQQEQPVETVASADTSEENQSLRPDNLQDKFWEPETQTPMWDKLTNSYNELEKAHTKKKDDIRAEILKERAESAPESYEFRLPEEVTLPEGVEIKDDDPLLLTFNKIAKQQGMTQEEYDEAVTLYINDELERMPDPKAELAKLGEKGQERINQLTAFLNAKLDDKHFETLQGFVTEAEGVEALEALVALTQQDPRPSNVSDTASAVGVTKDDLDRMMDDPRYWHPNKRDQKYVDRVTKAYQDFYGNKQYQQAG